MIFPKVTLEYVTLVSLANIEAETGVDAIAIAASSTDIKSLMERHPRAYAEQLKPGSLLSIEAAVNPTAAAIYSPYQDGYVASTYEIDDEGVIKSADVLPKSVISRLAREAAVILATALSKKNDAEILEATKIVAKALYDAGLLNAPATPEEISSGALTPDANTEYFENFSSEAPAKEDNSFHDKIVQYISANNPQQTDVKSYKLTSSVFIAPASEENQSNGFSWQIEFGEIDIEFAGVKVGSIGTWREFASQSILYLDLPEDVADSRATMLSINGLGSAFVERPAIQGKLDAMLDF